MAKVSYWKNLQNSYYSQEAEGHRQTQTAPETESSVWLETMHRTLRAGVECLSWRSPQKAVRDAQFIRSWLRAEPSGLQKAESSVCSVMLNVNNSIA
ncbi:hypothetical protein DV515_00006344 [Chloebia gouldiae]|uniref:Uncharacterized protein n=1 Tax=Chloebia gouldiae TaxID=44316 RepID=A0A3L8SLE6_CHLGU|nr:hypothetical protein DV515_00006344 [Chloebia gouldiae]